MPPDFEKHLAKLADVFIEVCLNVQPGQRLLIGSLSGLAGAPFELAPLIRLTVEKAYRRGARFVEVDWYDEQLRLIRHLSAPRDSFGEFRQWQTELAHQFAAAGDALLNFYAEDPDLLAGQDPEVLNQELTKYYEASAPTVGLLTGNAFNWGVVTGATQAWASKVFPDLTPEDAVIRLWELLFDICRVRGDDPVADWRQHVQSLIARKQYLNARRYRALKLTAPGTDLTIALPQGHLWNGGSLVSQGGIEYVPNIPTEEVFSLPDRLHVDGTVRATMPLNYNGTLIEDFQLTFAEGRVIDFQAGSGETTLTKLLDTDEGARRLGEIALVPHSSPIARSGLLFYNTLLDENAACHIALGSAYRFTLDGGETLSKEDFSAAGGNFSLVHVDFMIGSAAMNVDGITDSGDTEPVLRGGEWTITV